MSFTCQDYLYISCQRTWFRSQNEAAEDLDMLDLDLYIEVWEDKLGVFFYDQCVQNQVRFVQQNRLSSAHYGLNRMSKNTITLWFK